MLTNNCSLSAQLFFINLVFFNSFERNGNVPSIKVMSRREKKNANYHWKCQHRFHLIRFSHSLFTKCFQWLMAAQMQAVPKVGEEDKRSPADWKHLGDCREHSHIMQCWLRFDSALWSDSFDLGQCACVQLPETGLAEEEDRARRSRHWMVPLLLMEVLLTANVSVGVKYNQLVDAFGIKKVTMQQLFRIFGAHCWDVCHNVLFSLWLAALCTKDT